MAVKILIVDDTMTVILTLKTLLARSDFDIETAMSAEDALASAKKNPPDLILSDVMMPGMNGPELVRALKMDQRTQHIPVVMVTTQSNAEIVAECFAAGCADYIHKPINKLELLSKVRAIAPTSQHHWNISRSVREPEITF